MDSFFVKPGSNKRSKSDGQVNGGGSRFPAKRGGGGGGRDRGGGRSFGAGARGGGRQPRGGSRGSSRGGRPDGRMENHGTNGVKDGKKRFRAEEEEIPSDDEEGEEAEDNILLRREEEEAESDNEETEQEKRLRLTKDYLKQLEDATAGEERDVGDVLRDEVLDAAGRLRRPVAALYSGHDVDAMRIFRGHSGHKLAVACVASNGKSILCISEN